jgi:hypothetical protein
MAWSHTQDRSNPSYYAVYFDLPAAGQKQTNPRVSFAHIVRWSRGWEEL